jgi:hypothetical protein
LLGFAAQFGGFAACEEFAVGEGEARPVMGMPAFNLMREER